MGSSPSPWQSGVGDLLSKAKRIIANLLIGYYSLPDMPDNTRVRWLSTEEKELGRQRMIDAGKGKDVPITLRDIKRILGRWHFWVYTAYYT